jgi:hypothetical protein
MPLLEGGEIEVPSQSSAKERHERNATMGMKRRRQILQRLNTLDTGITEEDRRTERQATIKRTIETERELKWGRLQ